MMTTSVDIAKNIVKICAETLEEYGVPSSTGDSKPGKFVALPELFIAGEVYRKLRGTGFAISPETKLSYILSRLRQHSQAKNSSERVDLTIWRPRTKMPFATFELLWEWSGKNKIQKDLSRCGALRKAAGQSTYRPFIISLREGDIDNSKVNTFAEELQIRSKLIHSMCIKAPIVAHGVDSAAVATLSISAYIIN